jgi:hypothetical protein
MEINKLQLFVFMQGQVMHVKSNGTMELTRMVKPFRTSFKKEIGLPRNATRLEVLMGIGFAYQQFKAVDEFFAYLNKPHNLVDGKPLVTPEMLKAFCGE